MHTKQREKAEVIMQLSSFASTEPMKVLNEALDYFIQEARERNDTVTREELALNQGKIAAYLELRKHIFGGIRPLKKG